MALNTQPDAVLVRLLIETTLKQQGSQTKYNAPVFQALLDLLS